MQQYINHNGRYFDINEPTIKADNRAFCYGDGIFETIRIANKKPQFLKEHVVRLLNGMKVLKLEPDDRFSEAYFEQLIIELAAKNGIENDGRVRLTVYRNTGGLYTPEVNGASFLMTIKPIAERGYVLNEKGYIVDLFSEIYKPKNVLSAVKSTSSALYVMASLYKKEKGLDDCLLVNDKGQVLESISSNLFAVKNGVLYTSPLEEGCLNGIMRQTIIDVAKANRIGIHEVPIMQNVLLSADELFLTNAINGIRWIAGYKQKRYFNNTAKTLIDRLNELIKD
jgi:branched-subunit amino acid aminotransferase/4-amino-4-deoxychorismate lyase